MIQFSAAQDFYGLPTHLWHQTLTLGLYMFK